MKIKPMHWLALASLSIQWYETLIFYSMCYNRFSKVRIKIYKGNNIIFFNCLLACLNLKINIAKYLHSVILTGKAGNCWDGQWRWWWWQMMGDDDQRRGDNRINFWCNTSYPSKLIWQFWCEQPKSAVAGPTLVNSEDTNVFVTCKLH
jgi:hypothetical protein